MAILNKPGTDLEWCNLNPTDATSGQPAIINPSAGKKDSGFLRLEKPPRQDINWFQNLSGLWNGYLEILTDNAPAVNVLSYGMDVGNTGAQNTAALILALAASKNVFIPLGTFDMDGNITFPDGMNLFGVPGQVSGTTLNFTGSGDWDIKNKRIAIRNIVFIATEFISLTMLADHDDDKGMTLIDFCTFSGNSAGSLFFMDLDGGLGDDFGLINLNNCTAFGANMFENSVTFCPRIRATGCVFAASNFDFTSSSKSLRVFDDNIFLGGAYDISGSGTIFENNKFSGTCTFTFTGTDSCIVRDNMDEAGAIVVVADATSRAFFYNNRGEDGLIADVAELVTGVRYVGSYGSTSLGNGSNTKLNFSTSRSVSMARIGNYTKDIVEDGTGTFTFKGINNSSTKVECLINLFGTAPTGNFQAYLKLNGTNVFNFNKALVNASNTILTLNTTFLMSKGDTFEILFENQSGGSLTVGGTMNSMPSRIIVEGF